MAKTLLVHMGNDEPAHDEKHIDHQVALADEQANGGRNKLGHQIIKMIDSHQQRGNAAQRSEI